MRRATTGDDAGERDGALGLPKGQLAPNGRGLRVPQAATPARLFPRFRRLKRSSAATHMPTVGRPGERRAHEDCGRDGGWPWVIFSRSFFYLLAKPRGVSRMIRRFLFVCCVACLVCLARSGKRWAFLVPSLTGTDGAGWLLGKVGVWVRRGASIVARLRKINVDTSGIVTPRSGEVG